jgi:hypothetical protein
MKLCLVENLVCVSVISFCKISSQLLRI